jgi:predicted nucleic acid-binding protein
MRLQGEIEKWQIGDFRYYKIYRYLSLTLKFKSLASQFLAKSNLPAKASDDALHIALATFYGIDYLLTWNCKHIANAQIQKKLAQISIEAGYELPTICTPNELMGD